MSFDDLFSAASDRPTKTKAVEATIALDKILDREENTRALNQKHVGALAESIAALGLIEPIVVDIKGRLLAGGHRKKAIVQLREDKPEAFGLHFPGGQVPVRVMAIDAEADKAKAFEIEITENEKRKDYNKDEVRLLADRLKEMGYRSEGGKPKKGQKALMPELEVITGKSTSTIKRYLRDEVGDRDENTNTSADDRISFLKKFIDRLKGVDEMLEKAENSAIGVDVQDLRYIVPEVIRDAEYRYKSLQEKLTTDKNT